LYYVMCVFCFVYLDFVNLFLYLLCVCILYVFL